MKQDFTEQMDVEVELVKTELFKFCRWQDHWPVLENNAEDFFLGVFPELLNGKIWICIAFESAEKELEDERLLSIRKQLEQLKYKLFQDEDALCGVFGKHKCRYSSDFRYKCYCNPAIPEGE